MTSIPFKIETITTIAEDSPVGLSREEIASLFQKHKAHLLHFVQRYVRSWDDAEEVVQNTFVAALNGADRFSGLSKPSSWLFGIAVNIARNQCRHNGADRYQDVSEDYFDELPDFGADPEKIIHDRQLAVQVNKIFVDLSPKLRAAYMATCGGEVSYEEAAKQLGVPIGTVRSRLSRVRTAIRNGISESN